MDDEFYEEEYDDDTYFAESLNESTDAMIEDDEINSVEEAFMKGYNEDAEKSQQFEEDYDEDDLATQKESK